jgi:Chlorophyll A-B binding protein
MFRVIAFFSALLSVAAFMPVSRVSRASSLKMDFSNEAGVTSPLGFFDPLNLATAETFEAYRKSEITHGRVAQLAVIGYIVPEVFKFPGDIAPGIPFSSIPNGIAAIEAVPALGWLQIFFAIGSVDYYGFLKFNDGGASTKSAEELKELTTKELNNGRLAMIAILELLRHDSQHLVGGLYEGDNLITGLPFLY